MAKYGVTERLCLYYNVEDKDGQVHDLRNKNEHSRFMEVFAMSYCEKTYCENVTNIVLNFLPADYESWPDEELAQYLDDNYNTTDDFKEYFTVCYEYIDRNVLADNILRVIDLWLFGPHGCGNPRYEFRNWLAFSIAPATVIIIILVILQERRSRLIPWCYPRIGISYPVNLVDGFTDRLAYACCFGVTTGCILDLFHGDYYFEVDFECLDRLPPQWMTGAISTALSLLNVVVVGYIFAPFFMCLATPANITGNALGLLYIGYWTFYYNYTFIECPKQEKEVRFAFFLYTLPLVLCYNFLVLRFLFGLIFNIHFWYIKVDVRGEKRPNALRKLHRDYVYVHRLLRPPPPKPEETGIKNKVKNLMYKNAPGFKYSRRILCTIVVCFLAIYQTNLMNTYYIGSTLRYGCEELFVEGGPAMEFLESINQTEIFDQVQQAVCSLYTTFRISANVAVIIHTVYLFHMLTVYRRYMLRMYKGDKTFWPPELKSNLKLLVASLRYSGYQIAYMLWGYLITQLILWFTIFICVHGFFLAIRDGRNSILLYFIAEYWFTAVVAMFLYVIQILTAKFVFLLKTGKAFGINNRRVFHVTNYLLFFFNVVLGLFSCLLRIGKALIFGLLFLGRTDRCLLMKGFESYDTGFKAYLGFLKVEEAHTHPVLVTFCDLLAKHTSKLNYDVTKSSENEDDRLWCFRNRDKGTMVTETDLEIEWLGQAYKRSKLARNRWFVAYTLVRNPSLVFERSPNHILAVLQGLGKEVL
ncbi:stimulated by retinoic acid gene 6 protein-like [Glandiceps talaboti]